MIDNILNLLRADDYYGKSEVIEIAKGKYHLKTSIKDKKEQKKRAKLWQLRK